MRYIYKEILNGLVLVFLNVIITQNVAEPTLQYVPHVSSLNYDQLTTYDLPNFLS